MNLKHDKLMISVKEKNEKQITLTITFKTSKIASDFLQMITLNNQCKMFCHILRLQNIAYRIHA